MSRRLKPKAADFSFEFNGEGVPSVAGDTVASALLAAGTDIFSRSVKYHRPRGAFCLSGRCSHCLVRVDGVPNLFACVTRAAPGMKVSVQNVMGSAKHDVLASIDWLFPKGLDHHSMFAGVPIVESAMSKVARHLAGLGMLPDAVALADQKVELRACDVAIVGAGPAGLACARALKGSGLSVELIDEMELPGGRLAAGLTSSSDPDLAWAASTVEECRKSGVNFTPSATVLAVYREEERPMLAVRLKNPDRLLVLLAGKVALCNGTSEPLLAYQGNDLPGTYAARGLARLIRQKDVLPGTRAVVIGGTAEALALARLLLASGAKVEGVLDPEAGLKATDVKIFSRVTNLKARGVQAVGGISFTNAAGKITRLSCDLIAQADLPSPSVELARQAGAHVDFASARGGFFVETREAGATSAERIYAAGEITGAMSAAQAKDSGELLGKLLATAGKGRS